MDIIAAVGCQIFITQSTICGYNSSCWVSDIADNKNSWNITCTSLLSLLYVDIMAAVGCQILQTTKIDGI